MPRSRPRRTVATSSSEFYENSQLQNEGYIKVRELVSHVIIEKKHISSLTLEETRRHQNLEPTVNESVHRFRKWKNNTNFVSKNSEKNEPKPCKRDKVHSWFKRHFPTEEIEILSHENLTSNVDCDFLSSDVVVGCSRELSKPGSPQTLGDTRSGPKEIFNERFFNISSCPVKNHFNTLKFELNDDSDNYCLSLTDSRKKTLERPAIAYTSQFFAGKQHRTNF